MKAFANVSMCFIFTLLVFASQASASYSQGQVIEVINNYTIKVIVSDEVKVIRLAEIICPSTRFGSFPCAEKAKNFLREKTSGVKVTLDFWAIDTVGRTVCEVFLPDGTSLGKLLVSKGYSLQDKHYSDNPELASLEKNAQNNKLGVWEYVGQVL
jgi:micrococcal nuclease